MDRRFRYAFPLCFTFIDAVAVNIPLTTAPTSVPETLVLPPLSFIVVASIPVNCEPSPRYDDAVITPAFPNFILLPTSNCPPDTLIPVRNVPIPNESTFVTS